MLKQLLLQIALMIASFLTPFIYQWLNENFPGAPISESGILDIFIYIVSWIFTGIKGYRAYFIYQYNRYQTASKMYDVFTK
ncbi:MAG: hypothetical protein ACW972_02070 [Promethearchaeota archaeon]|jgi:uncharacterized membrane protein (DUF485 family)